MQGKIHDEEIYQISIQKIEKLVTEKKFRQKIEKRLSLIEENFNSELEKHGVIHAKNTALFALIISFYENLLEEDSSLLIDAALLHDIGRKNDFDDIKHGTTSALLAYNIKKHDNYYNSDSLSFLSALIEGHCYETYDNTVLEKYKIKDSRKYKKLIQIIKDADILDRIRLSKEALIDMNKLNYKISKKLFSFVQVENEKSAKKDNCKWKQQIVSRINEFLANNRRLISKNEFLEIKRKLFYLSKNEIYNLQTMKEYENEFLKYFTKVWQKELNAFESYNGIENFKFLVTCPTVRAEKFEFKPVISSSLLTNQHLGTFNKIPIAIVLEIEEESILGIGKKDMHSLAVDKNEVVDSYYYLNSTKTKKIYTKEPIMSLHTPKQIEISMIQENLAQNGAIAIRGEHSVYSDILLDGTKAKMTGIIIMEPCTKEWIEEAQKYANKLNLPIKKINTSYYYSKLGINSSEIKSGRGYNIYDICFLESVLKGTSNINSSNNLFVQQVGKNFLIKCDGLKDYLLYQPNERALHFIKKNDNSMIKMFYDGCDISYFYENEKVSKEEMTTVLEDLSSHNSIKK